MQTLALDIPIGDRMLLDALIRLKEADPSLRLPAAPAARACAARMR